MRQATLCFLVNEEKKLILLGMKKRGFGKGKWNGFGGKIQDDETIEEAALRELYEEIRIKARKEDINKVGEIEFIFPYKKENNQLVHVFIIKRWFGKPKESDEMIPKWFSIDALPFSAMWKDDRFWLHKVLENKRIKAKFIFNKDNETIKDYLIEEFEEFNFCKDF